VKLFAAARRLSKGDRLSRGERFLWLALETAGRVQALLDLTWDRVDFETGMISLNVPGRKKTKKRRAEVPMSKALRPILLRAYDERDGDLVLDTKAPIWTTLQHIAIEAGLAPKQVLRSGKKPTATGISPHVLRHTAATHMARRGVSLFLIAKVLGNGVQVVERTYAKYSPGDLQGAVDRISNGELTL
jgi:integrase